VAERLREQPALSLAEGGEPRLSLAGQLSLVQIIARRGRAADLTPRLGMALPERPNTAGTVEGGRIFCLRPNDWLLVKDDAAGRRGALAQDLRRRLAGIAAVIDQSHGRVALRLAGGHARALLQKGLDLDMHDSVFPPGAVAQAGLFGIAVLLHCRGPEDFELFVARSLAADLVHHLDAGSEVHQ